MTALKESEILAGLNPPQLEAVLHTEGPLLVLAGAGSGKTRMLTRRVAYLIASGRARRHEILAVTFTNKAAREMKERIEQLCGPGRWPFLGTFHSVCARWLRSHAERLGLAPSFVIYDSDEQMLLMKRVVKEMGLDEKLFSPRAVHAEISRLKNHLVDADEAARRANDPYRRNVAQAFALYQQQLRANQGVDYDDLLVLAVALFRRHPEVLEEFRQRLAYILIDEYQDVNPAQYELVKLLAGTRRNLCAVGDDDQSIYGFRGADLSILLRFEKDFPEARVVKLEQNYRSTQAILDVANALVRHNAGRHDKRLWTEERGGARPLVYGAADGRSEGRYVARTVQKLLDEGYLLGDMVVLYRTNAQSRLLEEAFMQAAIPYNVVGGVRFYDRKEIRDILGYLRLLANPADSVSLRRIVNTPPRGVGESSLAALEKFAAQQGLTLLEAVARASEAGVRSRTCLPLAQLTAWMDDLSRRIRQAEQAGAPMPVSDILLETLEKSGYRAWLEGQNSVEAQARLENVLELLNVTSEFDRTAEERTLQAFLSEVALISDQDTYQEEKQKVTLMTVHAAKGLEFPVVFVVGLEEETFPHARSLNEPAEMEEERRLAYVAITRARQRLYLSYAASRDIQGIPRPRLVSRFLREIPAALLERQDAAAPPPRARPSEEAAAGSGRYGGWTRSSPPRPRPAAGVAAASARPAPSFAAGQRVRHRIFGEGTVQQVDRGLVAVAFDDGKQRSVDQAYLVAAHSSAPAALGVGDRVQHPRWGSGVIKTVEGRSAVVIFPSITVHMPLDELR
ncbi:MAG TPA: UvrD-helicase domain-containing protein [Candidatus Nitrosotenuis sp.]|nr:UvrD-helicase domain-containing protein [Candidatus Nitrosotenuis sp.]